MPNVMLFGGCNLRGPFMRFRKAGQSLAHAVADWTNVPTGVTFSGSPHMTYTIGEMLQTIDLYKGRRYIPSEIRLLAGIRQEFAPNPRLGLRNIDALLVEPNTSLEIEFEGYSLNRNRVMEFIVPIRKLGADFDKLAGRWYQKGINSGNEALKMDLADALINMLPNDFPNLAFTMAFLRSARGVKKPLQPLFEELLSRVEVPIGVVTYTWQYMPDGRAVFWPADFGKDVKASALALDMPLLEVEHVVTNYGLGKAMRSDLRHYTEQFQPVIARALFDFVERIVCLPLKARSTGIVAEIVATA